MNVLHPYHAIACIFKPYDPTPGFTVAIKASSSIRLLCKLLDVPSDMNTGRRKSESAVSKGRARAESSCVSPLKRGQLFLPSGRTAGDLEAAFHQWGGTNVSRPHLRSDGAGAATCTADVWADGTDWIIRRRRE